ncbi:DUF4231 domain-containing protein [Nocardia sp. NPDC057440]|uniref:DUF4231 domain-containing protein n=1 Tax=Nocardia sp. NPDC057440 TaxID=3346134 RepID=UPI00366D1BBD
MQHADLGPRARRPARSDLDAEGGIAVSNDKFKPGSMDWFRQARTPAGAPVPPSVVTTWERYVRAGHQARLRHGTLEILNLVVAAAIPACAAFGVGNKWIVGLGSLAIVLNGCRQLFSWKESWANRKRVVYAIERQVALFCVGAAPYGTTKDAATLVEAVEEICAEHWEEWYARHLAVDGRPRQGGAE